MKISNGNRALIDLIRAEIKKRGPVSFAWFMQQALYQSEHGYYSSDRCAIGREGDYFTNVSVGPLFGQLLTAQFAEIWERLGRPNDFVLAEQGAHHGEFARDVLESLRQRSPDLFAVLQYVIVEPFSILQHRQSRMLELFRDKVQWRSSIEALEPFVGVHFSNELLDAMPLRLIVDGMEKLVDFDGQRFVFVDRPSAQEDFNEAALDWIANVTAKLESGYLLTVDYGHVGHDFQPAVQARAKHRHLDSPFEQIGYADITAHVHWTSIARCAEKNGVMIAGFTDQHYFLTGIISRWPDLIQNIGSKTKRALQTLLHPEMLGRSFQVLALVKNVDSIRPLAGFKFARNPRESLDI